MSDVLIKADGVSKKFAKDLKKSLLYGLADVTRGVLGKPFEERLRKDEFWAVQDVSFEVRRGECLGLIGHNGAGKSTLLKMLNGLIRPDKGRIEMRGRIGALIELGAGFNPILTGRENIYNSGAVLGFTRAEINKKFDEIVAFSELEDFLDMPVQSYSSGMRVRLGFAVAANMEPDVLLIDEVLAVGDIGFRVKCYNEIYRKLRNTAVIFVSHAMTQISKVCTHGMLLNHGKTMLVSDRVAEVISGYNNLVEGSTLSVSGSNKARLSYFAVSNPGQIGDWTYENPEDIKPATVNIAPNLPLTLQIHLEVADDIDYFIIVGSFSDEEDKIVSQTAIPEKPFKNDKKHHQITLHCPQLLLNSGRYNFSIEVIRSGPIGRDEVLLVLRNFLKMKIKREIYLGAAPLIYDNKWYAE